MEPRKLVFRWYLFHMFSANQTQIVYLPWAWRRLRYSSKLSAGLQASVSSSPLPSQSLTGCRSAWTWDRWGRAGWTWDHGCEPSSRLPIQRRGDRQRPEQACTCGGQCQRAVSKCQNRNRLGERMREERQGSGKKGGQWRVRS